MQTRSSNKTNAGLVNVCFILGTTATLRSQLLISGPTLYSIFKYVHATHIRDSRR